MVSEEFLDRVLGLNEHIPDVLLLRLFGIAVEWGGLTLEANMANRDITEALQKLTCELEGGENYPIRGHAVQVLEDFIGLVEDSKNSPEWGDVADFCRELCLLRRYGMPPLVLLREVADGLGVDSLPDFFEPHLEQLATNYPSPDARVVDLVAAAMAGLVVYHPDTGAIEVTEAGKQAKLSPSHLNGWIAKVIQAEYPTLTLSKISKAFPLDQVAYLASIRHSARTLADILCQTHRSNQGYHLTPGTRLGPLESWDLTDPQVSKALSRLREMAEVYGNPDDGRVINLLAKLLTGLAARAVNPGAVMQWYPVLRGPGGTGKTSFAELLAIGGQYVTSDANNIPELATLIGSSVCALDEIDVLVRKKELSELKSFTSQAKFKSRLSYRRDSELISATWVIIATTNAETLDVGDTANQRRQAIIDIPGNSEDGQRRIEWLKENIGILHTIGLELYRAGFSPNLAQDDLDRNQETNNTFVEPTQEVSDLEPRLDQLAEAIYSDGHLTGLNSEKLWALVAAQNKRWHPRKTTEMREMMESHGWTIISRGKFKYWAPPGCPEDVEVRPCHNDNVLNLRTMLARS